MNNTYTKSSITFKNYLLRYSYQLIGKQLLFLLDPEYVHKRIIAFGAWLGNYSITKKIINSLFYYRHPALQQTIAHITFPSPIGLAAGYDKEAQLTMIIPEIGFGFMEVGSITAWPYAGNPGQKLWRLKKSKSLVVNYGLQSSGAAVISHLLANKRTKIPLGINLAKTNTPTTNGEQRGIADYLQSYHMFTDPLIGDYITLNISCPNTLGGEPFLEPTALEHLLGSMAISRQRYNDTRPWFLKLSADISLTTVDRIIELARHYRVTGFICSNLTKNRNNINLVDNKIPPVGGLSGLPVRDLSDNLIRYIYQKTANEFIIIGCGGIFSASDAYRKIKAGASLVQLITGMIYKGPQLISEINYGLVECLRRDGFSTISEAIGSEQKQSKQQ